MAKQKAIETVKQVEWVSITEAFNRDPGYAINWLLHQPLFIACISFLTAFFFKVWWDILRDNSRENAKNAMLNMMSSFSKDQFEARTRHEEKLTGLISKLELNVNQNNIDNVRLEYTLNQINETLRIINKRIDKLERLKDADS